MTPGYDMELLFHLCDKTLAQITACRKHGAASWIAWRYDHLEREVREFRDVVFPSHVAPATEQEGGAK